MSKDQVDIAQFVLNVLLAIFTISLFIQGQVDRRRVAEDRRRQQAAKVSMLLNQPQLKRPGRTAAETSWQTAASFLEIFNDSDTGATGVMVFQRVHSSRPVGEAEPEWKLLDLVDDPIPAVIPYFAGGVSERNDCGLALSSHDLELHFTDGAGLSWVKTLRDGKLWPRDQDSVRWWSVWYQRLTQLPLVGKVFYWPIQHAIRRLRKSAPRIPLSARFARFPMGTRAGAGA